MPRYWLAALSFAFVSCALAQGDQAERQAAVQPGREARVGVFTNIRPDCTSGPLPVIRLAVPPAHGAVSVKRGTLKATNFKQCLATEVPALVVFYRAVADFTGADAFDLEIIAGGRKQSRHFRISVSNSPGGAEGI